jgi:competence protein ComEC
MRTLAWTAIHFAAAVFLAEYLLPVEGLPYIAAALVVCSAFGLALHGNRRRRALLAGLGAAAGLFWFWGHWQLTIVPAEKLAGQEMTVDARVTDYAQEEDGSESVTVRLIGDAPVHAKVQLILYGQELPALRPGDILTATVKLSSARTIGGEETNYYIAKGITLLGYGSGPAVTGRAHFTWIYFPKTLSKAFKDACGKVFSQDTAPLVKALMTGDKQDLKAEKQAYSDMRACGMLHAVAVSGMHMFYIVAFLQLLLGKRRRTSLLCLPLIFLFVLMTGCTASVVRAAVMQMFLLMAPLAERENDSATSLSAALALLLLINPDSAGDWGLQLSFACAVGLVLLLPPISVWNEKHFPMKIGPLRFVMESLACTVSATAFAMPLTAYYFGTISLLSWLANLLTLFVLEICFCAGYMLCALGMLFPAAAAVLAWPVAWLVRYCQTVYQFIARIPFSCLYTADALAGWWMVFAYTLFFAAYLLRRRTGGLRLVLPASLCVISLCVLVLTESARYRTDEGALTVLNVGQGESVAVLGGDATVMVDCGGTNTAKNAGDIAADYLLSCGRRQVELLVLTHLHEDHANGVTELMSRLDVERIMIAADLDDSDSLEEEIMEAAQRYGTSVYFIDGQSEADVGDIRLTLYTPQAGTDDNERGIIVRANLYGEDALIMGDAGDPAELALIKSGGTSDADILVVGHHGSRTASSSIFLNFIDAETAVISVGRNSYGQPADETLERLEEYCNCVMRTDTDGTVTVPMGAN